MKLKIKKGDLVQVITGDDKGKQGTVIKVFPTENKVVVEGVNMIKRHVKPTAENTQGGIVEREAPVQVSNVALINANTNKVERVGRKKDASGKLVRYFKKSGEVVPS